jgi:hypothetical protein
MIRIQQFLFLLLTLLFSSCISNKELNSYYKAKGYSSIKNSQISGLYLVPSDSSKFNLAEKLLDFAKISCEDLVVGENTVVSLEIRRSNRMFVKILQEKNIVKQFELRAKVHNNFVSVKRKLKITPIPFFYFHFEEKMILFLDNEGKLTAVIGNDQAGMVLFMVAGTNSTDIYKFDKVIPTMLSI